VNLGSCEKKNHASFLYRAIFLADTVGCGARIRPKGPMPWMSADTVYLYCRVSSLYVIFMITFMAPYINLYFPVAISNISIFFSLNRYCYSHLKYFSYFLFVAFSFMYVMYFYVFLVVRAVELLKTSTCIYVEALRGIKMIFKNSSHIFEALPLISQ
jgi:hypothetical protein